MTTGTLTRRKFIQSTGVAAGAAVAAPWIVPSTALGKGGVAPSNRITLGCIGVKNRGEKVMRSFLGLDEVEVVAVCDVDKQVLAKAKHRVQKSGGKGCAAYGDFRELISRKDIDAVMIATPDHWHAIPSILAFEHGKDVYCEKPLTLTIREGRAMADAATRYGRILQTGSQRRSSDRHRFACELVRNGYIGELKEVHVGISCSRPDSPHPWKPEPVPDHFDYDMWLGPTPWEPYTSGRCHYNFRFVSDYSGGEMTNWGAHFLDVAQWGMGMDDSGPVAVEGSGHRHATGLYDVWREVNVDYTYANGVKLKLRPGRHTTFIGTEGWIDAESLRCEPESLVRTKIKASDIHLARARGHVHSFVHAIKTRTQPTAPVEVGHRSATVCHLGNIAMSLGRPLKWDPKAERFIDDDAANRMTHRPCRAPWSL